ncbi:MAG: hypothetical protein M1829_002907 [Trizodia sp. TS-e1964]|nr:MAG: hypothetical protein M1829_002907 [Trizodia sp. TS-e1964]
MSVPAALESFVYLNIPYNIICCKNADCLHALSPRTASLHFHKKHYLSLILRKALDAFLNTLDNLASEELNRRPPHGLDPQPHLRIVSRLYNAITA